MAALAQQLELDYTTLSRAPGAIRARWRHRNHRNGRATPVTIPAKTTIADRIELFARAELDTDLPQRPRTRGECEICPTCQEWRDGQESARPEGKEIRDTDADSSSWAPEPSDLGGALRLREDDPRGGWEHAERRDPVLRMQASPISGEARDVRDSGVQRMEVHGESLSEPESGELSGLRGQRDHFLRPMGDLRGVLSGHGNAPKPEAFPGQNRQQQGVQPGELPMGNAYGPSAKQAQQPLVDREWGNSGARRMVGANGSEKDHDSRETASRLERLRCGHTTAEAVAHSRPCVFASCQFSTYLDVSDSGGIKLNRPDLDPTEVDPLWSCALDVAARGPHTLEEVASALNLTREAARQLVAQSTDKLRRVHLRVLSSLK